jgi:hypothetical protein
MKTNNLLCAPSTPINPPLSPALVARLEALEMRLKALDLDGIKKVQSTKEPKGDRHEFTR